MGMNRREFFKGAFSVMAMAAILKGRSDEPEIIGVDWASGPDCLVYVVQEYAGIIDKFYLVRDKEEIAEYWDKQINEPLRSQVDALPAVNTRSRPLG